MRMRDPMMDAELGQVLVESYAVNERMNQIVFQHLERGEGDIYDFWRPPVTPEDLFRTLCSEVPKTAALIERQQHILAGSNTAYTFAVRRVLSSITAPPDYAI